MNILIVGCCGVGKTWVMKNLLDPSMRKLKLGKICFHHKGSLVVVGKYDGSLFEGSDKLSMSVITDIGFLLSYLRSNKAHAVYEGDRFMNQTFIRKAKPTIIKIEGDGAEGRAKRGSKQTSGHLKRITTRVAKTSADYTVASSTACLHKVRELVATEYA